MPQSVLVAVPRNEVLFDVISGEVLLQRSDRHPCRCSVAAASVSALAAYCSSLIILHLSLGLRFGCEALTSPYERTLAHLYRFGNVRLKRTLSSDLSYIGE